MHYNFKPLNSLTLVLKTYGVSGCVYAYICRLKLDNVSIIIYRIGNY